MVCRFLKVQDQYSPFDEEELESFSDIRSEETLLSEKSKTHIQRHIHTDHITRL